MGVGAKVVSENEAEGGTETKEETTQKWEVKRKQCGGGNETVRGVRRQKNGSAEARAKRSRNGERSGAETVQEAEPKRCEKFS